MITTKKISRIALRALTPILMLASLSAPSLAQDTTATSVRHHSPSYETDVRNSKIVYVEGNDLVLKLENGRVEHLIVPDSDRFLIDGKSVAVGELRPGTTLTQTITTVTTPRYVNSVRVLKGKIWHANPPNNVILTLPDGTNQVYTIPKHATITVDGRPASVFDLKKGHMLQATIVTDEPQPIVSRNKSVIGQGPAPALPAMVGVLLFRSVAPTIAPVVASEPVQEPVTVASEESLPEVLPKTGSFVPIGSLVGLVVILISLGMRGARQRPAR